MDESESSDNDTNEFFFPRKGCETQEIVSYVNRAVSQAKLIVFMKGNRSIWLIYIGRTYLIVCLN